MRLKALSTKNVGETLLEFYSLTFIKCCITLYNVAVGKYECLIMYSVIPPVDTVVVAGVTDDK